MKESYSRIAIIGTGGLFPNASDLTELGLLLASGHSFIGSPSRTRQSLSGLEDEGHQAAYLDDIHSFDHKFFNISRRDAAYMNPVHRKLLEMSVATIENAGYSLNELRGTRTGVFIGESKNPAFDEISRRFPHSASYTGNIQAMAAGRIAYHLDLRGPALVIDTACSSSAVAVITACNLLLAGEIDFAIAGAVNIQPALWRKDDVDHLGIISKSGVCFPFDDKAEGIALGEGGGMVLLRRLQDAEAGKDNIHAVIIGTSWNQDGATSNGITAPSPELQKEVLLRAWEKAGIKADEIGYIEAHGTGTQLGDPIEAEALTRAFAAHTAKKQFCPIGSLKSNIGHLDHAAGIAGLIKSVVQINEGLIFPSINFTTPNKYIDFNESAVYVNCARKEWGLPREKRISGISSFGITGTNTHIVLQGYAPAALHPLTQREVIKISANSPASFAALADIYYDYFSKNEGVFIEQVATLNKGRSDWSFRYAFTFSSRQELLAQLRLLHNRISSEGAEQFRNEDKNVCLILSDAEMDSDQFDRMLAASNMLRKLYEAIPAEVRIDPVARQVAIQYVILKALMDLGLRVKQILCSGRGKLVRDIFTGKLQFSNLLRILKENNNPPSTPPDVNALVDSLKQAGCNAIIDAANGSALYQSLQASMEHAYFVKLSGNDAPADLAELISSCYNYGLGISWAGMYDESVQRAALPSYPMERVFCWPFEPEAAPAAESPEAMNDNIIDIIRKCWTEVLGEQEVADEDDFFHQGGHSINSAELAGMLSKQLELNMDVEDIYTYSTYRALCNFILEQKSKTAGNGQAKIPSIGFKDAYDLTPFQERIWLLSQDPGVGKAYNMVGGYFITGNLDLQRFTSAWNAIVEGYPVLRTKFTGKGGKIKQVITPVSAFPECLKFVDYSKYPDGEQYIRDVTEMEQDHLFALDTCPLIRGMLITLAQNRYCLIVNIHHIIADGRSMDIISKSLNELYAGLKTLPPPSVHFSDYVAWHAQKIQSDHKDLERFWKEEVRQIKLKKGLPTDFPRTTASVDGANIYHHISPGLSDSIKIFCQANNISEHSFLLGALLLLLANQTGSLNQTIGLTHHGRISADVENIPGVFINTILFNTTVAANETVAGFLLRLQSSVQEYIRHQHYPMQNLSKWLDAAAGRPGHSLMDTLFVYQEDKVQLSSPGLQFERIYIDFTKALSEIIFNITRRENSIMINLIYNTDLFGAGTIEHLLESYTGNIEKMVMAGDTKLMGTVLSYNNTNLIQ